jgi:hypothetical protein
MVIWGTWLKPQRYNLFKSAFAWGEQVLPAMMSTRWIIDMADIIVAHWRGLEDDA